MQAMEKWSEHTKRLPPLIIGDHVRIQNQTGQHPTRWDKTGSVIEVRQFDQYVVKVDGSDRVTLRNRKFLRKYTPAYTQQPRLTITDDITFRSLRPSAINTKPTTEPTTEPGPIQHEHSPSTPPPVTPKTPTVTPAPSIDPTTATTGLPQPESTPLPHPTAAASQPLAQSPPSPPTLSPATPVTGRPPRDRKPPRCIGRHPVNLSCNLSVFAHAKDLGEIENNYGDPLPIDLVVLSFVIHVLFSD